MKKPTRPILSLAWIALLAVASIPLTGCHVIHALGTHGHDDHDYWIVQPGHSR